MYIEFFIFPTYIVCRTFCSSVMHLAVGNCSAKPLHVVLPSEESMAYVDTSTFSMRLDVLMGLRFRINCKMWQCNSIVVAGRLVLSNKSIRNLFNCSVCELIVVFKTCNEHTNIDGRLLSVSVHVKYSV